MGPASGGFPCPHWAKRKRKNKNDLRDTMPRTGERDQGGLFFQQDHYWKGVVRTLPRCLRKKRKGWNIVLRKMGEKTRSPRCPKPVRWGGGGGETFSRWNLYSSRKMKGGAPREVNEDCMKATRQGFPHAPEEKELPLYLLRWGVERNPEWGVHGQSKNMKKELEGGLVIRWAGVREERGGTGGQNFHRVVLSRSEQQDESWNR